MNNKNNNDNNNNNSSNNNINNNEHMEPNSMLLFVFQWDHLQSTFGNNLQFGIIYILRSNLGIISGLGISCGAVQVQV